MSEDIKPEVIKRTQDLLGKYFKKPPLTEKLLKRPPFRFIQDIVLAIIKETGFFEGLFTEEELSIDISKDKEAKLAYLTKLIDVVKLITGVNLTVRATKIVSGQEPIKTNELLQTIGRALDKKINSKEAIIYYKSRPEKKCNAKKPVNKEHSSKKSIIENSIRSTKPVNKEQQVTDSEKKKAWKVKLQDRGAKEKFKDEKVTKQLENKHKNSTKKINEKLTQSLAIFSVEKVIDNSVSAELLAPSKFKEISDSANCSVSTISELQTPQAKSVLPKKCDEPVIGIKIERQSKDSKKQTESVDRLDSRKYTESFKYNNELNINLQNAMQQENIVSAKLPDSTWIVVGNNRVDVANIIVEKSEQKEEAEDDMVIIETNNGSLFELTEQKEINATEEHGCLVAQILKTEQELVSINNTDTPNNKVEIVWQTGIIRDRESVIKTVGILRNLIQTLIKFTNPLGKILDYLQGDMEIMQKELVDYQNQYAAANKLLADERMQTDKFMHHMQESLEDIELNVYNQLNKIYQVKVNISKNEHQIQRLLNNYA